MRRVAAALDDKAKEFDYLFSETIELEENFKSTKKDLVTAKETDPKSSGETETLKVQLTAYTG